ncbi:MAG: EF-hand domain-containing protein [bacterium]
MIDGINGISGFGAASWARPAPPSFKDMDSNSDGVIDKTELASIAPNGDSDVDKILEKVDTNQDGVIDESEDKAARAEMEEKMQARAQASANESLAGILSDLVSTLQNSEDDDEDSDPLAIAQNYLNQRISAYGQGGAMDQSLSKSLFSVVA